MAGIRDAGSVGNAIAHDCKVHGASAGRLGQVVMLAIDGSWRRDAPGSHLRACIVGVGREAGGSARSYATSAHSPYPPNR